MGVLVLSFNEVLTTVTAGRPFTIHVILFFAHQITNTALEMEKKSDEMCEGKVERSKNWKVFAILSFPPFATLFILCCAAICVDRSQPPTASFVVVTSYRLGYLYNHQQREQKYIKYLFF